MGNEFKDFEMETPSLTLEPDLGEFEKKEEVLPKKQTQKEEVPVLTPEEQKMVNDLLQRLILRILIRFFSMVQEPRKKWRTFLIQLLRM